jgi:hypothetical protein
MNAYSRAGFKWSVNEVLSLQREFELLGWDIDQIAAKHKRSPDAIMCKLDYEGLADFNVLYSNYLALNSPISVSGKQTDALNLLSEYDDDVEDLDDETVDDGDEEYLDDGADDEDDEDDDDEDEVATLSERVERLEESIFEIRDMIKKLMTSISVNKSNGTGCFM